MIDSGNEPVEISMHFSPEDWTETSLPGLVRSYQDKIHAMGAQRQDIVTQVDKPADGSVDVHVCWDRRGSVMNPMTGKDVRARPGRYQNTSGLVMFTDEEGETYVELQDEHSVPLPSPEQPTRRHESTDDRPERRPVPWSWFVIVGAGLLAAVGGMDWIRRRTAARKPRNSKGADDAH